MIENKDSKGKPESPFDGKVIKILIFELLREHHYGKKEQESFPTLHALTEQPLQFDLCSRYTRETYN